MIGAARFAWTVELRVDELDADHPLAGPVWAWGWVVAIDGYRVAAGVEATPGDARKAGQGALARAMRGMGEP